MNARGSSCLRLDHKTTCPLVQSMTRNPGRLDTLDVSSKNQGSSGLLFKYEFPANSPLFVEVGSPSLDARIPTLERILRRNIRVSNNTPRTPNPSNLIGTRLEHKIKIRNSFSAGAYHNIAQRERPPLQAHTLAPSKKLARPPCKWRCAPKPKTHNGSTAEVRALVPWGASFFSGEESVACWESFWPSRSHNPAMPHHHQHHSSTIKPASLIPHPHIHTEVS